MYFNFIRLFEEKPIIDFADLVCGDKNILIPFYNKNDIKKLNLLVDVFDLKGCKNYLDKTFLSGGVMCIYNGYYKIYKLNENNEIDEMKIYREDKGLKYLLDLNQVLDYTSFNAIIRKNK